MLKYFLRRLKYMYICIVYENVYQNTFKDIQTTFKIICGFVRVLKLDIQKRSLYNSLTVPELKIVGTHIYHCKFKTTGKTVCKYPCQTSAQCWSVKIDRNVNLIVRKTTERNKYQTTRKRLEVRCFQCNNEHQQRRFCVTYVNRKWGLDTIRFV